MEKAQIRIIRSKRKTVALEIRPDLLRKAQQLYSN